MQVPEFDRMRSLWWVVTALLLAVVVGVVYSFVGTFVFALFIYYATRPAYRRIGKRVGSRSAAAALAILVFAVPALALLAYTLAIALQELSGLEGIDVDPVVSLVDPYVDVSKAVDDPASLLAQTPDIGTVQGALGSVVDSIGFVGNGLLHLFVMLALAFYLLRDGKRLAAWVHRYGDDGGVLEAYLEAVDRSLAEIFFGNILNAIVTGAIGAIAFSVLNVFAPPGLQIPYPAVVGLLTGVGSLIPVVGMKIVYVPMVAYLGVQSALAGTGYGFVGLVFLVSLFVVDLLPDFVLRPYVSGRDLHVGLVMFAYILGPLLFGWYGIFLGPLLLALIYHFARIVLPELLTGTDVEPRAVDPEALQTDDASATGEDGQSTAGTATTDGSGPDSGDGASDSPADGTSTVGRQPSEEDAPETESCAGEGTGAGDTDDEQV